MSDYNIEQVEALTGFARRTIRYYIQKGLVEAPFGARKTPSYTERHVEQLLQIKKFKQAGLNLGRIAELLAEPESSRHVNTLEIEDTQLIQRVQVVDGITLDIDTNRVTLNQDQIRNIGNWMADYLAGQGK